MRWEKIKRWIRYLIDYLILFSSLKQQILISVPVSQASGINLGCFSSGSLPRRCQASCRDSSHLKSPLGLEDLLPSSHGYWQASVPCWLWQEASILCHMVISIVLLLTWQLAYLRVSDERLSGVTMLWERKKKNLNNLEKNKQFKRSNSHDFGHS